MPPIRRSRAAPRENKHPKPTYSGTGTGVSTGRPAKKALRLASMMPLRR
jgi:hypothetical protein